MKYLKSRPDKNNNKETVHLSQLYRCENPNTSISNQTYHYKDIQLDKCNLLLIKHGIE